MYVVENYVFRFQVSVDNLVFMHVIEGFERLLDDIFCEGFGKFTFFLQKVVKLPWKAQL